MKKITFTITITTILVLTLTACSGTNTGNRSNFQGGANQQGSATQQGGANQQGLSLPEKLAVGTLKLEGTSTAVTAKEAADLLPMWQVYSSLITSDTAAQEEKDALIQQIQGTMTSDQIKAIDSLNLTQRDVFTSMQQLGITTASSQIDANGTPQPGGNGGNFFRGGGGFGGGGDFGGGGGGFNRGGGNGGQFGPSQIATAQALRAANGGGGFNNNRLLTPLIDAVIKLLKSKS